MNRRRFFQSAAATPLVTLLPQIANADEYVSRVNRGVCQTLEGLENIETGQSFQHTEGRFSLVYFGTATSIYGAACGFDMDELYAAVDLYGSPQIQNHVDLIFVYPRPNNNDAQTLVNTYVKDEERGHFIGLQASDNAQLLSVTREYGAPYEIDRRSGEIVNHARSSVLIGPNGEFLRQYNAGTPNFLISDDIESVLRNYTAIEPPCTPALS